ncbi:hypothetical protein ONS95_004002 [Cadophora gregata]|uniref:uncharacterized protein n=1 Tax=Cadophora gregata TaxID=51156 RepID=UPI0026DBE33E|nr:uncharacterized protein ONS95_004002 [Cadophora gregata]KAK0107305.1 hypothetical protein ONS95_004002 [Cadophora gregata]
MANINQPAPSRVAPTLLDILEQYGIFNALCCRLDTASLFALRRVTKSLHGDFAAHAKERWNVNRRLKHFVKHPQGLRTMMARYNALISGSFVIQFFDDDFWKGSDLDIYVEREAAAAFGTYLAQNEEYRFEKSSTIEHNYDLSGIYKTDTYLRGEKDSGNETKIQIISTRSIPVSCMLGCFTSTAVMNFMSWNAAYSMFPELTFLEPRRQLKLCTGQEDDNEMERIQAHVEKYRKLGWKLLPQQDTKESPSPSLQVERTRRVGDHFSWKLALDVDGVQPSSVPDYVLEHCHFGIRCSNNSMGTEAREESYESGAYDLTSHVLKYKYTYSTSKADFWHAFMSTRLHGLIIAELREVDEDTLPAFLDLSAPDGTRNSTTSWHVS